jgi:hypothetical protein
MRRNIENRGHHRSNRIDAPVKIESADLSILFSRDGNSLLPGTLHFVVSMDRSGRWPR